GGVGAGVDGEEGGQDEVEVHGQEGAGVVPVPRGGSEPGGVHVVHVCERMGGVDLGAVVGGAAGQVMLEQLMAPNSIKSGEALLDLCTSAIALGNTIAVHTLEYLSIAKNPRAGIKECAVEFLEASRALFPAKVSLERSPAQFSPDITQELRDRFGQTKNVFFILDQTINKLLSNEKAHGLGKLGKGFRGMFSDSEILRLKASLAQCRASVQISTLMFPSLPDG
ncbi:putative ankyrin repeat protein, partial [Teratosphaeria destructans]